MYIKSLLTISLCITAIGGDNLIEFVDDHLIKAIIDNATHSLIGGLSWAIVFYIKNTIFMREVLWEVILCMAISSLIDIDHFIAAKSLKLQDVHLLKSRPFLHDTTLTISVWILLYVVSFILKNELLQNITWIYFVAFVSHHTRDATRRGYWFHPFGSTVPINYWIYILITVTIPWITVYLSTLIKLKKTQEYSYSIV